MKRLFRVVYFYNITITVFVYAEMRKVNTFVNIKVFTFSEACKKTQII